ncbi:MAG: hypothetical protein ACRDKE_00145 [Solirubrobacterales bacterium]
MRLIKNTTKNSGLVAIIVAAIMVVGGGSAVAGSMITGKQIKNSTITGKDIKNKSLSVSDISQKSRDALKGNVGPAGPTGQTGSQGPMVERFTSAESESTSTSQTPVFENVEINVPQGATKLLIHFNAECAVADPGAYRTQYVGVRVDGDVVQNSAAACSNTSDYDEMRPSSVSVQRWINVAPGTHSVTINQWVSNNSAVGTLVDKTLTVLAAN